MIDRYHLRYFLAVVEAGNFSRAARQVNVTQPTLSVGISKLEQSLGAKVFLRNSQRVQLTEAGAHLLAHAKAIEREFAVLDAGLSVSGPPSVVRLGILSTIPTAVSEAIVAHNRLAAAPDAIEIVEGSERDLISRLHRRRLDLALTILRPGHAGLRHEFLMREKYALAMPAWHPLAQEAVVAPGGLAHEVMIVRRHCEVLSETSRHFTEHGVRPRFSFRTTNDDRALAMVRAGLGITVMPQSFRDIGVSRPRLLGFEYERDIGLVFGDRQEERLARFSTLIEAVRAAVGHA